MSELQKPWLNSYPNDVPSEADLYAFENINDLFDHSSKEYASKTAIINMSKALTYQKVAMRVAWLQAYFQQIWNLRKGEKIALMLPNINQYPICVFAALKAGLTVVNVNPMYTPRELKLLLNDSDATAIVVLENFAHSLASIVQETKVKHVMIAKIGDCFGFKGRLFNLYMRLSGSVQAYKIENAITFKQASLVGSKLEPIAVEVKRDDIAFLQYTGGTTGIPKGAMLSHGNIVSNVMQAYAMYGPRIELGAEKFLTVIPLYHVFAMSVNLMFMYYVGAANLLITDPRRLKSFIKDLKSHSDITIITGVNTLFNALVQHKAFADVKFEHLNLVIGGGSAVQSAVAERFYKSTGVHIFEGYGLTECSPLVCVVPHNSKVYTSSIGIPVPSTEVGIMDDNGKLIYDLDVEGELVVKGPQVMQGYYKNPMATRSTIIDGYCHTGDVAVWKEGGYIKLIDRIKDMILVSGFNVFPTEIEDVVSKLEGVVECAVIGIASEQTAEAVCLYVVKKHGYKLSREDIIEHCRKNLTAYKIPHEIIFMRSLPKTTVGKILRRELRDIYKKSHQ